MVPKRASFSLLALCLLSAISHIRSESTAGIRLRLHKLAEDYIAIHKARQRASMETQIHFFQKSWQNYYKNMNNHYQQ